ncbi:MAG: S1 RNA-binding domain-containing protein [Candidatus Verstraetearchaeota archaeon]|nr:S1 RNA-binding domain-containing protein [Candidatus Verstraetearchaeota archaeon]
MPVFFSQRQFVVPGELLAEGNYMAGSNVYRVGNKFFSSSVGLAELKDRTVTVIALSGCYIPRPADLVIGEIVEVSMASWMVDINSPYQAILFASEFLSKPLNPLKEDPRRYLDVGDMVIAKVLNFDRTKNPSLTAKEKGLGKITKGIVVEIDVTKIPRVIGRRGSMVSMLKKETGCEIIVGQNGRIWISGKTREDEMIVMEAIKKIEREAHTSGLTDRVRELILKMKKSQGG